MTLEVEFPNVVACLALLNDENLTVSETIASIHVLCQLEVHSDWWAETKRWAQ